MIAWLAGIIGSVFTLRTFLAGLFMTIIGIVIYNLAVEMFIEVANFAVSKAGSLASPGAAIESITGFAAWFCMLMRVPECVSVLTSTVVLKFLLRKIPFLKW